jgi:hypothetical protein
MLNQDQAIFLNETTPLSKKDKKRVIKVEMFKAGPQLDSEGDYKVFSTKDLDDVVKTYNPQKHEAPLIVGHEQTDSTPSLGWVQKLWRDGQSLMGAIELTPRAEKMIREGTFKKVSSSFYTPEAPTNPTPGKMSLRHLALVSIPAVKGLADFTESLKDSHYINISNNFSEKSVKDYLDTNTKTMRRRKKSVSDHAEGFDITINISDKNKASAMYDDSGTKLDATGNVADYTDESMQQQQQQQPYNAFPPKQPYDPNMGGMQQPYDDTKDSFADEPGMADGDMDADNPAPTDAPTDPSADSGMDTDTEDPMDDSLDDGSGEDDGMGTEDLSGEMDDEDDEIAELAANYTHQQLYQALQLQKEAKASLGGSSDFGEMGDGEEDEDEDKPAKKFPPKKNDKGEDDEEDIDEEATKEFAASCKSKNYEEDEDSDDDGDISSLKERVQQLEEELMKQKRLAREKEVSDFCESLYSQGKLTEKIVNRKDLSKFLVTLNSKNSVNFSEGGKQSQYRFMKSLLKRLPGVVSFNEIATPSSAPKKPKSSMPEADGYSYDSQSLDTHNKAMNYAETHGVDYVTALKHVLN